MESGERKRVRVSQACDQCRRRKDRCDSGRPKCKPCCKAGRSCTYNPSTKKRGLPTGYVRATESLLGLVFCSIDGYEATLQQLLRGELENTDSRCPAAITGRDSAASEVLLDAWRKSGVLKEVDRLLIAAEALDTEGAGREQNDSDFAALNPSENDTADDHDLNLPRFQLVSQVTTNPAILLIPRIEESEEIISQPLKSLPLPPPMGEAASLTDSQPETLQSKLPSNWSQLLDIHFANTHAWFPISHKQDLLRPAYLLAHGPSTDLANLIPGEKAFLWSALALSSHQLEKLVHQRGDVQAFEAPQAPSRQLSSNAEILLSPASDVYNIGHLRALMLLTLIQIDRGCWAAAWSLVGRAVFVAVDLGMPASPREDLSKQAGAVLDEGQRRAFLGCFALDTLVSVRLGRRPYLRHYDLQSIGAVHTDGIEEWEARRASDLCTDNDVQGGQLANYTPGHVLSIFNHFVNLMGLLNDSLCVKGHSAEATNLSAIAQSYDRWKSLLPAHCRLPVSATTQTRPSTQLFNLTLASECLHVMLGKQTLQDEDSSPRNGDTFASYTQLKMAIEEQIGRSGRAWIPPTFESYIFCCRDTALLQNLSLGNVNARGLYKKGRNAVVDTPADKAGESTAISVGLSSFKTGDTLFTFDPNVLSPVSQSKSPVASKILTGATPIYQESQQIIQGLPDFTTNLGDNFILDDSVLPLPNDSGEDNLFDRLAMLDPIDWSAAQPEFMRNLGLTSTSTSNQFQSLFNLDAI